MCPIFFRDHSQHPQLHNLALERLDVIKHGTQVHTSLFLTNPGFTFYFLAFSKSLSSPYNSICFQIMICVFLTQIWSTVYFFLASAGRHNGDILYRRERRTLFRNKRFMLDEMIQRNASKFAIFYVYENPYSFFRFSFRVSFLFSTNECPSLCMLT